MRPPAFALVRLALASSLAALPLLAAPALAATSTVIGQATFDPATTTIKLPYDGPAPAPQLYRISGTHYYYDFPSARLERPGVTYKRVGTQLERFTIARRPTGHTVRLSFTLTRPATPSLVVDEATRTLRIQPLGQTGQPASSPRAQAPSPSPHAQPPSPKPPAQRPAAGQRTTLGRPAFDEPRGMIVLPFQGPVPEYRSGVADDDPRWVYFDFEQAVPAAGPRPYGQFEDPIFLRWVMARRPQRPAARLSVRLNASRALKVELHPDLGQIWLLVPGRFGASQQGEPVAPALLPFPRASKAP